METPAGYFMSRHSMLDKITLYRITDISVLSIQIVIKIRILSQP